MASTSIHLSRNLVASLDALAARRKISRNRLIAEACERLVQQDLGEWPEGFFSNDDLSPADLRLLRRAGREMETAIRRQRRSRRRSPFS